MNGHANGFCVSLSKSLSEISSQVSISVQNKFKKWGTKLKMQQ